MKINIDLSSYFIINLEIVLVAVIFVYLFNTIRKGADEILSRHDVD